MKTQFLKQSALRFAIASAFAVGSLAGVNAVAATASSTATSTVIAPIAVTAGAVLSFGRFSVLAVGGTVDVDTDNTLSKTGGVTLGTGATGTAAQFDVTGDANNTYSITHGGAAVLTSGANTMALTKVSALTAASGTSGNVATGTLSGAGAQTVFVGGSLAVAASQPAGTYTGSVSVTVEYN
jgi:hypothetical protein